MQYDLQLLLIFEEGLDETKIKGLNDVYDDLTCLPCKYWKLGPLSKLLDPSTFISYIENQSISIELKGYRVELSIIYFVWLENPAQ